MTTPVLVMRRFGPAPLTGRRSVSTMAVMKGKRVALVAGLGALAVLIVAVVVGWPRILSWYRFMQVFESLGRNAQGYQEYRHRQTGIVMVLLPGGSFFMGAQKEDPSGPNYDPEAGDAEGPVHKVRLSPFLIAKYEVTQAQWEPIMGMRTWPIGAPIKIGMNAKVIFMFPAQQAVGDITWIDVQRFGAKTGLGLPTEAEWEYACRGGSSTPIAGTGKLDDMGWYKENSGDSTHPIGKKAPNGFGLHDMHGNVWEWCEDVYDEGFYKKPEARETDPFSDTGSEGRVFRGGSCDRGAVSCRSSTRFRVPPSCRYGSLGFRPAWRWP